MASQSLPSLSSSYFFRSFSSPEIQLGGWGQWGALYCKDPQCMGRSASHQMFSCISEFLLTDLFTYLLTYLLIDWLTYLLTYLLSLSPILSTVSWIFAAFEFHLMKRHV